MSDDDNFEDTLASRATELFKICDHQNKGYITEDDLSIVAEELSLPLTEEQITLTFSKLDKDNNKHLTLAEFISGFDLFLGAQDSDTNYNTLDYTQGHQLFDLCDREQKGYIVKSDLERLAGEFHLTEEQLGDLFHSLDIDGNGCLTLEEFVAGFGQFLETTEADEELEPRAEYPLSPVERIYESHTDSGVNSPALSEDVIFEKIADKVGDDLLSG
jgi:Ca2+-binding EF-hand superfamily protein